MFSIRNYNDLVAKKEIISNILDTQNITCLCGERLYSTDLAFYQYPNSQDYWLYAHCTYCNYDLNYQKIYRRYIALKDQDKRIAGVKEKSGSTELR